MKRTDWIAICGMVVTVLLTTIGSTVHLSYKIGSLDEKVASLGKTTDDLKQDIKEIRQDIATIQVQIAEMRIKLDILWRRHEDEVRTLIMPDKKTLNTLKNSEIGEFANQHYDEILSRMKTFKPENEIQTQELLITLVNDFKRDHEYRSKLSKVVISTGCDVDTVLFGVALAIKDRIVSDLGFKK